MKEEKTNIIPYNNAGGQSQPQKDYSNSNRSKMMPSGTPAASPPAMPRSEISTVKSDGFFKATLKQAVDHAIKTVIDPMIRNFVYSTGMSILNTLLWNGGKGSPGLPTGIGMTPYNVISTSIGQSQNQKSQMTRDDRVWQRYEKLHVDTLDAANAIMSRLYRIYMRKGEVKLAEYYEAFGEKYEFQDEGWGWSALPKDKMYAQQFADGYHVLMPKLEKLS